MAISYKVINDDSDNLSAACRLQISGMRVQIYREIRVMYSELLKRKEEASVVLGGTASGLISGGEIAPFLRYRTL